MKVSDYMDMALEEARIALERGEVPVGAVITHGERIIARCHNECERLNDATAHAELLAIRRAGETLSDWRLDGCTLYCTLEPCAMCAGAIANSRLALVVYGAADEKCGALGSALDVLAATPGCKTKYVGGCRKEKCAEIIKSAFKGKRK